MRVDGYEKCRRLKSKEHRDRIHYRNYARIVYEPRDVSRVQRQESYQVLITK